MPLYSVDIEKLFQSFWTNRYIIEADSLDAAVSQSSAIAGAEAAIHLNIVSLTRMRVSTMEEGDDSYQIIQLNTMGSRSTGGEWLPLFNTCRVDFTTIGGGRPSRKYLRLPVDEPIVQNGTFTSAFRALMQTSYIEPLLGAGVGFVDVDGQQFASGTVYPQIAMRQLRRGSRRRASPVLG